MGQSRRRGLHGAIIAQAIADRNQRNKALKAAKNPTAKFESHGRVNEERRRAREGMRKHRASNRTQRKPMWQSTGNEIHASAPVVLHSLLCDKTWQVFKAVRTENRCCKAWATKAQQESQ